MHEWRYVHAQRARKLKKMAGVACYVAWVDDYGHTVYQWQRVTDRKYVPQEAKS